MLSQLEIVCTDDKIISYGYLANGDLAYCLCEDLSSDGVEAIYSAKIERVNAKNKLAFINYASDKSGVINLVHNNSKVTTSSLIKVKESVKHESKIIEKNSKLEAGAYLLCQMSWLGDKSKLPKFIWPIKLIGKFVILLSEDKKNDPKHFFAKDLQDKSKLITLSQKYKYLGLIFRSQINDLIDLSVVEAEIIFLKQKLDLINQAPSNVVGQITKPVYKFMQLLRGVRFVDDLKIITNNEQIFEDLQPYLDLWLIDKITLDHKLSNEIYNANIETASLNTASQQVLRHDSHNNLFYNIPQHVICNKVFDNKVITSQGLSLEINQLSGINLIDINGQDTNLTFYQVNYLAIDEIVRQIWLRDLTGIILIDFIKNISLLQQQQIEDKLAKAFNKDWRHTKMLGFTKAGICELIRKK